MRPEITYPFAPKSTSRLRPGQFWAVPLTDGSFGCGRVLQLGAEEIPSKSRGFFGGLLRWRSHAPPTCETIAGAPLLDWGVMHIRAILLTGGEIIGLPSLDKDRIEIPRLLSAHGGVGTMILHGAQHVRLASSADLGTLPVLSIWGYNVITRIAEARLGSAVA